MTTSTRTSANRKRLYGIAATRDKWLVAAWRMQYELHDDPDSPSLRALHKKASAMAQALSTRLEKTSRALRWPS